MKQHLNTLFVQTQGTYLAKDGEAVAVRGEGADGKRTTLLRVPVHNLGGVVAFGRVGVSPALMGLCCERGVSVTLMTEHGRLLGRVTGFTSRQRAACDASSTAGPTTRRRRRSWRGTSSRARSPTAAASCCAICGTTPSPRGARPSARPRPGSRWWGWT